jgi:alanine racemase
VVTGETGVLNWIEVDAAALGNNIAEFRRRLGSQVKLGAVVKANAYGHGMLEVASVVRDRVDWLCVNNLDEAVRLHEADARKPILIMGYVARNDLEEIVLRELRPVVYNRDTVEKLEEIASRHHRRVFLHLKIETGTHRQGVVEADVPPLVELIRNSQWLELEGLATSRARGRGAAPAHRLLGRDDPLHAHPPRPGSRRDLTLRAVALA